MVASISTTLSGNPSAGNPDFVSYLGGSGDDQGLGIALDQSSVNFGTYVSGATNPPTDFPTANFYQQFLNGTAYDAFVSKLGSNSALKLAPHTGSPSPNPYVPVGTQVACTFDTTNIGPDPAPSVQFTGTWIPPTGVTSQAAKVVSGTGA